MWSGEREKAKEKVLLANVVLQTVTFFTGAEVMKPVKLIKLHTSPVTVVTTVNKLVTFSL